MSKSVRLLNVGKSNASLKEKMFVNDLCREI